MTTRYQVRTETGSEYVIDLTLKTWERLKRENSSGKLRTESGTYQEIEPIKLGEGVLMICDPLPESVPGTTGRMVLTSNVVEITEL